MMLMSIYQMVKKLIGEIEPYGDTNIDERRKMDLEEYNTLVYNLLKDIINVAKFRDRPEASINKLGESAYLALIEFKEMIEEIYEKTFETIENRSIFVMDEVIRCTKCKGEFIVKDGTFNFCPRCGRKII